MAKKCTKYHLYCLFLKILLTNSKKVSKVWTNSCFLNIRKEIMTNNKIQFIQKYKEKSNDVIVSSIFATYQKIIDGAYINSFTEEDIRNINQFYTYLTICSAIQLLDAPQKLVAYEEMKNCVGNYPYTLEMKKAFLEQYIKLLHYSKMEDSHLSLRKA